MSCFPAMGVCSRRGRRLRLPLAWLAGLGLVAAVVPAQGQTLPAAPTAEAPAAEPQAGDVATTDTLPPAGEGTTANQQYVATTEQQFGKNSRQTAEAYSDLAAAQRRDGDHDAAADSYLTAIEIYRAIDGPFTPLAIPLLTSLGDNYHEDGNDLSAVSVYSEARSLNRRAFGLLNEKQIVLLDRLSESLLDLNKPLEADAQQVEALHLVERNWPPESDEALAGIYRYAAWLRERGAYQLERDQYVRALRIIRDHYGKDDIREVEPLVGIANSFRNQRIPEGQGAGALQDALALLLAAPDQDARKVAAVLRDEGDWQVAFNRTGYDGAEYRRAWALLGEVPDGEQLRKEWFTGATYVLREPVSLRDLSEEPNAPSGHVVIRFDLNRDGQSSNVEVVESDPPGLKDEAVLRHIRRSRFRPQMVDGEFVNREALALQFNFRYTPDATVSDTDSDNKKSRRH